MSIEIKSDILAKELNQGIVPLGVPKAYQYDAALVEAARAAVNQGIDDVTEAGDTAVNSVKAQEYTSTTNINTLGDKILAQMKHGYGYPFTAATAAAMADTTKIYVYTGSETGYINGNWYYWNGTAWTSGGVYNATALETDKTLTISGAAADAKAVNDKFKANSNSKGFRGNEILATLTSKSYSDESYGFANYRAYAYPMKISGKISGIFYRCKIKSDTSIDDGTSRNVALTFAIYDTDTMSNEPTPIYSITVTKEVTFTNNRGVAYERKLIINDEINLPSKYFLKVEVETGYKLCVGSGITSPANVSKYFDYSRVGYYMSDDGNWSKMAGGFFVANAGIYTESDEPIPTDYGVIAYEESAPSGVQAKNLVLIDTSNNTVKVNNSFYVFRSNGGLKKGDYARDGWFWVKAQTVAYNIGEYENSPNRASRSLYASTYFNDLYVAFYPESADDLKLCSFTNSNIYDARTGSISINGHSMYDANTISRSVLSANMALSKNCREDRVCYGYMSGGWDKTHKGYGFRFKKMNPYIKSIYLNNRICVSTAYSQETTEDVTLYFHFYNDSMQEIIPPISHTASVTYPANYNYASWEAEVPISGGFERFDGHDYIIVCVNTADSKFKMASNYFKNDSNFGFNHSVIKPLNNVKAYYTDSSSISPDWMTTNEYYVIDLRLISFDPNVNDVPERICSLQDAFTHWMNGEKFPIGISGDSTLDGYRTTNYVANTVGSDHTTGFLMTDIAQTKLREETGNNVLRVYNAGFSGKTVDWAINHFWTEILNNAHYSDVKMLGIMMGINDRPQNLSGYEAFKENITEFVKLCYYNGIQPFLITPQTGAENSSAISRWQWITKSYAERAYHEIAKEYNLELIDMSKYTAHLLQYSNQPFQKICYDFCHFNDYGHAYEGGVIFKHFIPRTIDVDGDMTIQLNTSGIKSDLLWGDNDYGVRQSQVDMLSQPVNGFKLQANCTKSNTADVVIMDAWIFISANSPMNLISYAGEINQLHVLVDGNNTVITTNEQDLGTLDVGLHHIVVKSGMTSAVNFYGLKLSR